MSSPANPLSLDEMFSLATRSDSSPKSFLELFLDKGLKDSHGEPKQLGDLETMTVGEFAQGHFLHRGRLLFSVHQLVAMVLLFEVTYAMHDSGDPRCTEWLALPDKMDAGEYLVRRLMGPIWNIPVAHVLRGA